MSGKSERGPYASGLARREAIMDAAVDLLADVGYHGMTLRDVARQVGISHPGVIYHFPSKEVLLMSVVSRYEEQMGFDLDELERLDAMPVLESMLILLSRLDENPMIVEVECMLTVESSSDIHPAHDHFESSNARLHQVLKKAWSRLFQEGKVRSGEKPDELATSQISLYQGIMTRWLYDHELDAVGIMVHFYMHIFSPECVDEISQRFHDSGWIK